MRSLALAVLCACGSSAGAGTEADAGAEACACADASVDASADANTVVIGDAGALSALDVPGMTPTFSPDVHDYAVRCAAGANTFTVTFTDASGSHTQTVALAPDEALVVDGDWVRCLPPDFPVITIATHGAGPTPGWFLADATTYALVLDVRGTPVWYARGASVMNVDAQTPNVISMTPNASGGFGTDPATRFDLHALADGTTQRVQAATTPTDAHELRLLPNGDALLFTFPVVQTDAGTRIGDCEIQEVDAQSKLVWSWDALAHVDVAKESLTQTTTKVNGLDVLDVFHCNSIDVDRATGAVKWKLGGTSYVGDGGVHVDVVGDSEVGFSLQHDARFSASGVTLFDDHGASAGVARGVEYAIDFDAKTATPIFQFLGGGQSQYEGSFRRQGDGHSIIGWGHVAADPRTFTEVDAQGNDVLDVTIANVTSYRVVKAPTTALDIALLRATASRW